MKNYENMMQMVSEHSFNYKDLRNSVAYLACYNLHKYSVLHFCIALHEALIAKLL
jgi:hypothetical protein